jgi:hypothetical protein
MAGHKPVTVRIPRPRLRQLMRARKVKSQSELSDRVRLLRLDYLVEWGQSRFSGLRCTNSIRK